MSHDNTYSPQSGAKLTLSSLQQFQSPDVDQYHPSLTSLWRKNLPAYGQTHEAVLSQILAVEPIIGEIRFRNDRREDDQYLSQYLEDITRIEFSQDNPPSSSPDELGSSVGKFEKSLSPLSPYLRMETPNGLIGKLSAIETEKDRIRVNPRLILNTVYLQQLSAQVHEAEHVLGSLRGKNNFNSLGIIDPEKQWWSLAFPIAHETIYLLPIAKATLVVGFFSSPEKELLHRRSYVLSWNEKNHDQTETALLLDTLLKNEVAVMDRSFGELQMRTLERRALIRHGLVLWEQGGDAQSEKARRYICGSLTPMEQFSLLPQLMSQQGTPESDRRTWSTLRNVLQKEISLSYLPPHFQVYFVRPTEEYPLVGEMLQKMAHGTSKRNAGNSYDPNVEKSSYLTMEQQVDLVEKIISYSFSSLNLLSNEQQDFARRVNYLLTRGESK